jgi:hypothetical protein
MAPAPYFQVFPDCIAPVKAVESSSPEDTGCRTPQSRPTLWGDEASEQGDGAMMWNLDEMPEAELLETAEVLD